MPFPTTAFGIAAIVVLLVPGLTYGLVRRTLRGFRFDDLTIDARIAQALVVSVLLDAIYLAVGAAWIASVVHIEGNKVFVEEPGLLGLAVLAGAFAIPGLLSFVLNSPYRIRRRVPKAPRVVRPKKRKKQRAQSKYVIERTTYYEAVPTAWDKGATDPRGRAVRVTLPDGRMLGGFFGSGSYVSTYPEPRDLYLSHQYFVEADGTLGELIPGTAGVWLRISDDHIVEFFDPPDATGDDLTDNERTESNGE
ncbi:DUF6338 family protein [Leifsonia sp. NPDC014704]|uniref:DUF6338 family protein n=1 Tax=Leifsonia sp. NPDC014704 TaxID=3364123 RepID=UPI0036F47861